MRQIKKDISNNTNSRYNYCNILTDDNGSYYLEPLSNIEINISENDQYHRVEPHEVGRLDLISQKYYGTPFLWWLIAYASNLSDPISFPDGILLRIPPKETKEIIRK